MATDLSGGVRTERPARRRIAEHQLERIFNPLFTTKTGGMGMGLTICRSIIEAHDGRLWATPNVPEGAIFQFRLLADVGAPAAGARGQAADAVRTGSRQ